MRHLIECWAGTKDTLLSWELQKQRKDGTRLWVQEFARVMTDPEGRTTLLISCEDITEHKRLERLEQERLSRVIRFQAVQLELDRLPYHNLMENFQAITKLASQALQVERAGIWLFTDDHSTLVCREQYRLSLDRHERGASLKLADYPRYGESLEQDLLLAAADALNDPRTSDFVASYLEPLGIVSMMDAAVRRDGKVIGVVCFEQTGATRNWTSDEQAFAASIADHVSLCVTDDERRQAEHTLARSEQRLRTVLDTLPVGVWFTDAAGTVQFSNPASQRIWGEAASIVLSRPRTEEQWEEPVTDGMPHRWALSGTLSNDTSPLHERLMIRHADGTTKVINNTAVSVHDDTGKKVGAIVVNEDVTEQIRMAEREAARSEQLKRLSELSLVLSGDPSEIFTRVVRMIGELFKVRAVCLSEIAGQELHFKAVYANGAVRLDAGRCPLAVTPCAIVNLEKDVRLFDRVTERFPEASFLRDHEAVSYRGFPVLDNNGQVVAITSLLDDKPREFTDEDQRLLRVFGQRIAMEIERAGFIAEQQQQADALEQSHAFIRQIIDTDPNFIFAKDRAGRFILVNRAVAEAYGTTVDRLIGKTDADFNPNRAEVDQFRNKDLEVMDTGRGLLIPEEVITDSSGTTRWLQTVKRPIFDKHGAASMVLGVSTDISERKKMEDALRLTQYAVDHADDYMFLIGPDGYFMDVNESACRRLGYTKHDLLTMSVMDIDPDFPPAVWETFWQEFRRTKRIHLETRHRSKSGETYPVEVTANYFLHNGRELDYAVVRDISERKRAEESIARSRALLQSVIHTAPIRVFWKDRDSRYLGCNSLFASDAGLSSIDQIIGQTDDDLVWREQAARYQADDRQVMESGVAKLSFEEPQTTPIGARIWLKTSKVPLYDEHQRVVGVLGIYDDITDRKRAEEALRQREQDLKRALDERERISEDLHDGILQSIYAIGLGLEACKPLISDQPKNSAAKLKAVIQRTIGQLNHVLEEVRNFIAGLESHIMDGQEFDIVLRTMIHALADPYPIPYRVTIDQAATQELSTEQAYHVMNIAREALSNSFRHSEASRIRLSLRQLRRSIRLSVKDNGVGFNSTATHDVGHGLANMAARARKIGGKFTLQSKPRQGTTVLVDLPRRLADADN